MSRTQERGFSNHCPKAMSRSKLTSSGAAIPVAALILLAGNLRATLTSVGPLIEQIRHSTHISLTAAGLLTSLPLVAFGAFAPLGHFGRRFGMERMSVFALLLLTIGTLIRSNGSVAGLFAGSMCLAAGIAIGNVLVPGLIKRDYPGRIKGLTTLYAVMLSLIPAIASGLAVPLSDWLPGGWRSALAVWSIPAGIAILVWLPFALRPGGEANPTQASSSSVWRSALAWQVTAFMGLQSLAYYSSIAWMPTILQSDGYTPSQAGSLIAVYQVAALALSATMPFLLRGTSNQSLFACSAGVAIAASICGLLLFPAGAVVWMILMGFGGGASVMLALTFISLRSANHQQAASLSIMSQSIGYLLAAAGTFLFGVIHDVAGNWSVPLLLLIGVSLVMALAGFGAGRLRTVA